jgi:hypothetical protein
MVSFPRLVPESAATGQFWICDFRFLILSGEMLSAPEYIPNVNKSGQEGTVEQTIRDAILLALLKD